MKKGTYKDLTGKRFGNLVVLSFNSHKNRRRTYWNCLCDCGNITVVDGSHLVTGHTRSCGCLAIERISQLNYINGLSQTRLNRVYRGMLNRCRNKNIPIYKYYGGRGIKVCDEWLPKNNGFYNFCKWAFEHNYDETLSIDRIDTNGDYTPYNCRFVDIITQANNRRTNVIISFDDSVGTIAEISREFNIPYDVIRSAIRSGQKKCMGHNLHKIGRKY